MILRSMKSWQRGRAATASRAYGRALLAQLVLMTLTLGFAAPASALTLLPDPQDELDENRIRWNELGIADYDYRFERVCFCTPDFVRPGIISVRAGAIAWVLDPDDASPLDSGLYLTLDELFDEIQDAIDDWADDLLVSYEPTRGYPRSIEIDYFFGLADDEIGYRVSDFAPIPEPSTALLISLGLVGLATGRRGERF